jgi:hypothetical protein
MTTHFPLWFQLRRVRLRCHPHHHHSMGGHIRRKAPRRFP